MSNGKCKEWERVKIVYFQGMQVQWKSRRDLLSIFAWYFSRLLKLFEKSCNQLLHFSWYLNFQSIQQYQGIFVAIILMITLHIGTGIIHFTITASFHFTNRFYMKPIWKHMSNYYNLLLFLLYFTVRTWYRFLKNYVCR